MIVLEEPSPEKTENDNGKVWSANETPDINF